MNIKSRNVLLIQRKKKKGVLKNTDGSTRRLKVTGEESERWPPLGTKAM